MNCIQLTNAVLFGGVDGDNSTELLVSNAVYDSVTNAVATLSRFFDADEERSFDVEIVRSDGVLNVAVSFDTYYFQFEKMRERTFDAVFARAKRFIITALDDDNMVNVKLIY